ncbi:MAG TPA: DNA methyltransferase [Chloroflexia bacterium]|nr:DNA methyltransferase [Chloroflexia bacterium]
MEEKILGKVNKAPRNRTIELTVEDEARYNNLFRLEPGFNYSPTELRNRLILGDCVSGLAQLPAQWADLIIADPPYNLTKTYGQGVFARRNLEEYRAWTEQWVAAAARALKPAGSIYVCIDWESSGLLQQVLAKHFIIKNRITWKRDKGRGATANWKNNMEDIWFAVVSETYTFNLDAVKVRKPIIAPYRDSTGRPKDWIEQQDGERYRMTHPSNIWTDLTVPFWSMPENTPHPTQKPEKLIERLLLASSNPGNLVLDPFMGSGTTASVARRLGRDYIGFELDEWYYKLTLKRLDTQVLPKYRAQSQA